MLEVAEDFALTHVSHQHDVAGEGDILVVNALTLPLSQQVACLVSFLA
jgi:hypothetical protein